MESKWLFHKVLAFKKPSQLGRKCRFQYHLAGFGNVCRAAWLLACGFPNPNNSRVRRMEALIRRGVKQLPPRKVPGPRAKVSRFWLYEHAVAFLANYVLTHSEHSPVSPTLYVDFCGYRNLHKLYHNECRATATKAVSRKVFMRLFRELRARGVDEPSTGEHFHVEFRTRNARGFSKCDTCEYYSSKMKFAKDTTERETFSRLKAEHIDNVADDRKELARLAR